MAIRSLLVPVHGAAEDERQVDTACLLAHRSGGHVEALFVRDIRPLFTPDEGFSPSMREAWIDELREEVARREEEARIRFIRTMEQKGLTYLEGAPAPARAAPPGRLAQAPGPVTASWLSAEGETAQIVGERSGAYDLTVVGRPMEKAHDWRAAAAEGALFGTGRVALLAPPVAPSRLGESVAIGWNNTAQSARAVACALPLLEQAARVTILAIATRAKRGPSGHDIARRLAWHGIDATVLEFAPDSRKVGEALLAETARCGADLLVMGAYSHNRLRELILGGVTQYVMDHADLPVLMAH